ncbi:imidazole glycerol phosphate synthase subunit HisF [Flavobacterium sedimenticola]|uniref:Imidazole glycerol phosphate synthase subunit HisF n=1 Tax=Flavobacterium sedimenticola TaxID=3043286 RepID=A0ABT6XM76_9FLAO|nr:imidazole glycerol phosphate synthase subunit HisF [Flavobacterium sedimenticola]MDI9256190.1 imidazole glycerol phosphate synthase subunit HisF [Flavobacterium sedimenticola]
MLKKRIIPCLDIKDGRVVKGVQFLALKEAGNPVALASFYSKSGADELVFLDISATLEGRKTLVDLVKRLSKEINIPFTVGGGIQSVEDAQLLLQSGADKVSLNSAAVSHPKLITQIAEAFGSQSVVVAIDIKKVDNNWYVFVKGGTESTEILAIDWARKAEALGAGELLITSMNNDGAKDGFALDITRQICQAVSIPVIASGGAGSANDFIDLFTKTEVSAGLAASIFHFNEVSIPDLKTLLKTLNIPVR